MGWWEAPDGLVGGDAPLDAYRAAMRVLAVRFSEAVERLPFLHEVVSGLDASVPSGPSPTYDALVRSLAGDAPLVSTRPPPLLTGELLALPYAEGRATTLLVLFGSERRKGEGPGYGACLVPLDAAPSEVATDLDRVRTAAWLTRPFHPGSDFGGERVGRVALVPDASFLPCFEWYARDGSSARSAWPAPGLERRVYDYFGVDVTGAPGVDSRVIEGSVGAAGLVVAVRAALGLNRALPWSPHRRVSEAAPLAALPPFVACAPEKPEEARPPKPADDALCATVTQVLEGATAKCQRDWREAFGRDATREELARAIATVLAASAPKMLADPTRMETVERPPVPGVVSEPRSPDAPQLVFEHRNVDIVRVITSTTRWSAFPFREHGGLVLETLGASGDVLDRVPAILRCWRDACGLPHVAEPVVVRPMEWGEPTRIDA